LPQCSGFDKAQTMKLSILVAVCFVAGILAASAEHVWAQDASVSAIPDGSARPPAQEDPRPAVKSVPADATSPPATPSASPSAKDEETADEDENATSPDKKYAFLFGREEDEKSIDLIDNKTKKVLQHIDDQEMGSVSYGVLWAPDSKGFALMTRMGHPNQGVDVYFLKGKKFEKVEMPEMTADIPAKVRHGKKYGHVSNNNWQTAVKWNKDGSLLVTVDSMIDGSGYTASAVRTVVLGFDKSKKAKILKSSIKYEASKD
jgi:hypothetical protein